MMGVLRRGTPSSSAKEVLIPVGMVPSSTMVTLSGAMVSPILPSSFDFPLATLSPLTAWKRV